METVKQTGLIIVQPAPEDYVSGGFTAIPDQIRVENGSWRPWLPSPEKQYKYATFDTFACVSFASLNTLEMQFNFLIREKVFSDEQISRLTALGFLDEQGNFNASDRFTAIMSNTTTNGNDFKTVWESIRLNGILPEKDLPFGGNSFAEYHNKALITQEMIQKAKEILSIVTIQWEWVFFDNNPSFDLTAVQATQKALEQAPVEIAIPLPSHHATTMFEMDENVSFTSFDTYEPFIFEDDWSVPIHFAVKGYITPKIDEPFLFTKDLHLGTRDPEVAQLQKRLNQNPITQVATSGPGAPGNETSYFGPATHNAVLKYQRLFRINPTSGYVGALTRKVLNGGSYAVNTPVTSKIDAWCEAIKTHEGWFAPGVSAAYPDGSVSFRNNNPGNLKYVGQKRAVGKRGSFCVFATYDDGYTELKEMLIRACTGKSANYKPDMTLLEFYEVYAPSYDDNVPASYAAAVAKRIGVTTTTQIKTLI